jgi:hypothetical protein
VSRSVRDLQGYIAGIAKIDNNALLAFQRLDGCRFIIIRSKEFSVRIDTFDDRRSHQAVDALVMVNAKYNWIHRISLS